MKYLFTVFILIYSLNILSQNTITDSEYYSDKDISISLRPQNCIDKKRGTAKQYYFIEIVNKSNKELNVSFKKELWFDGVCQTCNINSEEYYSSIILSANETVSGSCENMDKKLRIFSKMLNLDKVRKLTKYELKNIKVESIK